MTKKINTLPAKVIHRFTPLVVFIQSHLYISTIIILLLYLALFQSGFLLSGDTWAESYTEYLVKATTGRAREIYASSWEGYVTLLPSIFSKLYVRAGWSLGYIDYYFRLIAVGFAVLCAAFIAAPINRRVIKNDLVRILMALATIMLLYHPSSFSFINIWYIGFLPIFLIALNPQKLKVWQQIAYVIYALLVAFTKPSIILAPFTVYRAYKTKEYISNGIILLSTFWQTYLLFFETSNGTRTVALGVMDIAKAIYFGGSIGILKLLSIPPNVLLIALINFIIVALLVIIFRERRWLVGGVVLTGYLFSIYSNLLAPNAGTVFQASAIYENDYKLQRWLLTNIFLVLIFFLPFEKLYRAVVARQSKTKWACVIIVVLMMGLLYRPIDTRSSAVFADISPFRQSLSMNQKACVPVAPMPTWSAGTNWYFQYQGGCSFVNYDKTPDPGSFTQELDKPVKIGFDGIGRGSIMAVVVLVKSDTALAHLYLRDMQGGKVLTSSVAPNTDDDLRFVSFNLAGYPDRTQYDFELYSDNQNIRLGSFTEDGEPTAYAYYMGMPAN